MAQPAGTSELISRDAAWSVLTEFTRSDSLRKHARAVEASMRAYARRYGEDPEAWGVAGMLHDFDYEMHPRAPQHPLKGAEILLARGVPERLVRAILAHADYAGMPRVALLERALYACDELSGFVHAVALVQPGHGIGYALVLMGAMGLLGSAIFDLLVTPKVVGGSVGVHPLLTLFSLMLGAQLLGILGMVIAVPVAASIQVALAHFYPQILDDLRAADEILLSGTTIEDKVERSVRAKGLPVSVPPEKGLPVSVPPEKGLPVSVPPEKGLPMSEPPEKLRSGLRNWRFSRTTTKLGSTCSCSSSSPDRTNSGMAHPKKAREAQRTTSRRSIIEVPPSSCADPVWSRGRAAC